MGKFGRKLRKGFKKVGKTFARTITRPVAAITGKSVVSRRGTFFEKGLGRKFDRAMKGATKGQLIATALVVGGKAASTAIKPKPTTGTAKGSFISKIFKPKPTTGTEKSSFISKIFKPKPTTGTEKSSFISKIFKPKPTTDFSTKTNVNKMGFLSKLTKSGLIKGALRGARTGLTSSLTGGSLTSKMLPSLNVSGNISDLDGGSSFLGIGSKKREAEEAEKKKMNNIIYIGLGLSVLGILVGLFRNN